MLVNDVFMDRFPEAKVTVLYSFKSDHKALWLSTMIVQRRPRFEQPFRFVASWLLHENFSEFMSKMWVREASWIHNVHEFSSQVLNWKKEVYGHVGRRKRQILNRLEGINRSLNCDGPRA